MYFLNLKLINSKEMPDRFDLQKFVQMSDNVYDLMDSYFILQIKRLPQYGTTIVSGEEGHPELIADRVYGSVNFWYLLLIYNDMISSEEIKEGMLIRYPKIEDLEELYFKLNALQRSGASGILK